jgi:MoaA/NifB/PqqE/SkfB family radical SAM enzyme
MPNGMRIADFYRFHRTRDHFRGDFLMLSPELLTSAYRKVKSRKAKAVAMGVLRTFGFRHLVIRMDTINLCNLRCKMCYYSSDYNRKKDEMDLPLFRRIADQVFPKTRFLYLSCATEPTMNKRFADILSTTAEYKVPFTSFCTNGQFLREEVVQSAIEGKISEIIFSVDGATAETYEHIRRGGKWDRLVASMDLLASMKERASVRNPVTRINFTCMSRNLHELPQMVHFAADHGVHNLHVRHLLAYTDEDQSCRQEMLYVRNFNAVAAEAQREAARRRVTLVLPDPVPAGSEAPGKTCYTDGRRGEANPYCLLPWFQAIINWSGDYRICSTHCKLGNLREQTFEEIYNGPYLREVRRKMLWGSADSCSRDCREEAYDVPDQAEDANKDLLSIAPVPRA